jgi:hypothetical protein
VRNAIASPWAPVLSCVTATMWNSVVPSVSANASSSAAISSAGVRA